MIEGLLSGVEVELAVVRLSGQEKQALGVRGGELRVAIVDGRVLVPAGERVDVRRQRLGQAGRKLGVLDEGVGAELEHGFAVLAQ